jgi:hypothetical protein
MAMFQIEGDFDFEEFFKRALEIIKDEKDASVRKEGGRPESSDETPGSQIIMRVKSKYSDSYNKILVSHRGKVQFFYESPNDFRRCLGLLQWLLWDARSFDERFKNLQLADVDVFEMCLAFFEHKYIRIMNDRSAACTKFGLAPSREFLRDNMQAALVDFFRAFLNEIEKLRKEGNNLNGVYNSSLAWMTTLWKYFTWLLIELWEDSEAAGEVINSTVEHLNSLEMKFRRQSHLMIEQALSENEKSLIQDWKNVSAYYRKNPF